MLVHFYRSLPDSVLPGDLELVFETELAHLPRGGDVIRLLWPTADNTYCIEFQVVDIDWLFDKAYPAYEDSGDPDKPTINPQSKLRYVEVWVQPHTKDDEAVWEKVKMALREGAADAALEREG
jgi:hypothetical protein